ncbi:hypothetical protein FCM35_KLT06740 [Carex littledalei]|uniref:Uncharacterized protein n=1 Tax=Carex littledalei TaxID=544730 RepID=A0A833QS08_9POAL|nr:hypothetical protein FCM35_KLT06740 [Carex littledalei]
MFLTDVQDVVQCPTTVVPFFGDQPFWGEMVHARGVGPAPIPIEQFNKEAVKEKANEMAKAMESEDGVTGAVNAFFKHLPSASPPPDHEEESRGIFKRLKDKFHLKPSS